MVLVTHGHVHNLQHSSLVAIPGGVHVSSFAPIPYIFAPFNYVHLAAGPTHQVDIKFRPSDNVCTVYSQEYSSLTFDYPSV